jgi:hypothetical protein
VDETTGKTVAGTPPDGEAHAPRVEETRGSGVGEMIHPPSAGDAVHAASTSTPEMDAARAIERRPKPSWRVLLAPIFAVAGWFVPGMGHALLGRWGRALGFFIAVGGLAVTGLVLRGNVFTLHSGDAFGTLGFLSEAGSGIFYFGARFVEAAGPELARASGEVGTRFIATAGIVNLLSVLDAFEIARGRRR